jgi:hypothetical protein
MHKLLYIPTGELIDFIKAGSTTKDVEFTNYWEESIWYKVWNEDMDDVIEQFCHPEKEIATKNRHKIPVDVILSKNEFEVINETV